MIETAEVVAERYGVGRERQDEYALESQRRTAAAQQAGKFKDEIVPLATKMKKVDKATGQESIVEYTVDHDECNRPDTTLEGLQVAEARVRGRHEDQGRQIHHGRQRLAVLRRRVGLRGDGFGQVARSSKASSRSASSAASRSRLRARRDGHRPGVRRAAPARAPRPESRRHRSVGIERGVREPGALLRRQARHSARQAERRTAARFPSAILTACRARA